MTIYYFSIKLKIPKITFLKSVSGSRQIGCLMHYFFRDRISCFWSKIRQRTQTYSCISRLFKILVFVSIFPLLFATYRNQLSIWKISSISTTADFVSFIFKLKDLKLENMKGKKKRGFQNIFDFWKNKQISSSVLIIASFRETCESSFGRIFATSFFS